MKIAICDDEQTHREKLRKIIKDCDILPVDAVLFEYSNGSALIYGHAENRHDIIFLDIQMDGMNGLETSHKIRSGDRDVIIIFLTGFEQHMPQSFRIEAFDYIVKPAEESRISDVLNRALRKYKDLHCLIKFKWGDDVYALDVGDIVYIESMKRKLKIVTADPDEKDYEIIGKLNDYDRQLQKYGFLRCHHSFLINMNYIKIIEDTFIKAKSGHSVYMSTRKKHFCLQSFNTFITKYRVR
ncbi:MAG: LytTR family DNA-binding domain-containing protein [Oscillospiraceae bacterium]|nr:LytTR family DNA-binding domain-containing protein [Oscillospiraceae bacterium]MCL2278236.1 LytTR family DNA-binding domain-containing protein [Oscillospiraceae bacterium]